MMRSGGIFVLAALLLNGVGAQASVLDKESCEKLELEQTKLEHAGVRTTIAKGPAWGKANLPLDKLQEVRRLIEVDELLTFRCQGKPLVLLPSSVDADPPPPTPDDAAKDPEGKAVPKAEAPKDAPKDAPKAPPVKKAAAPKVEKAEPKPKAEPKAQPKAEAPAQVPAPVPAKKAAAPPAPKDPAKAEPKKAAPGQAVATPKPAPKKKVDDAYKPAPSTEPGENPFAGQMPQN